MSILKQSGRHPQNGRSAALVGMAEDQPSRAALLSIDGISKRYGETQALRSASLDVAAGEVHALVGENGSGKSTLVKVLCGVTSPDDGLVRLDDAPVRFKGPGDARRAGIAPVFQETLAAAELSVVGNIFIGSDGLFRRSQPRSVELVRARKILARLGLPKIDLDRPVWTLSLEHQQLVTVARALVQRWKLLVLDEATSALDVEGRERLFEVVAEEVREGEVSALFVSHRMDEVMHSSHRITVLRAGETVGVVRTSEAQLDQVLAMMAGPNRVDPAREGTGAPATLQVACADEARPVLNLRGVVLKPGATPFDLTVCEGEVLGVAALEGQGQMDLLGCVAGTSRPEAGTVLAYSDEEPTDIHHSLVPAQHAREAFRQGIVYVPTDRKKEGIFPGLSVLDNMILPSLGRLSRFGVIRRGKAAMEVSAAVQSLGIKTAGLRLRIEALSGGNQQKIVLGRWLLTSPRVLVLNDPMRGVDPGARHDLLNVLQQLAGEGVAILLYSTELEELHALCGQVAVVRDHSVTQILEGDRLTTDAVIAAMFGRSNEMAGPQ